MQEQIKAEQIKTEQKTVLLTDEQIKELVTRCPAECLGHAYELLTSGKCGTISHAINAANKGERKRNGAKKSLRSFSDITENGAIETDKQAIDLELTADLAESLTAELLAILSETDALKLERVINGEKLGNNRQTDYNKRKELRRKCVEAIERMY